MTPPEPTAPDAIGVDEILRRLDLAIAGHKDTAVTGTLTGWKVTNRRWGHGDLCATTPDGDGIAHRLPVTVPPPVTYRAQRRYGPRLAPGAAAVVHGQLEIGDRWNPLRLVATHLDITAAESDLATRQRTLLDDLTESGRATRNRTLELPVTLTRIGLISPASESAGRADFVDRLALNPSPIIAIERRVTMSGPAAPGAIATAIADLTALDVEAIIVCRGGGVAADLAAFDTPAVAHAIVASRHPIVIAVGHAVDRSVADQVAHTSLPTPTAAADWIVSRSTAALNAARERTLAAATSTATTQAAHARHEAQRERARADRDRRRARTAITVAAALAVLLLLVLAAQLLR